MRIKKDPEVRRAELINVAFGLFCTIGYEKTMIIDIVKKAGVAKGTFFYYFPTKESILETIIQGYATEFCTEYETISRNLTALHKLKLFIERLFIPSQYDILFDKLWNEKQYYLLYMTWKQVEAVFNPLLSNIIKQGNQEGSTNVPLAIDETIAFMWSTVNCLWEASYNKDTPEIFISKVKIAEIILERILEIKEGSLGLTIPPQ